MSARTVRRLAWSALVASLALVVGLPALWLATRPAQSLGSLDAVEAALAEPSSTPIAATPAPAPAPAAAPLPDVRLAAAPPPARRAPAARAERPRGLDVGRRDARIGRLRPAWRATPRRVRIDAIGVAADVAPYGVAADGSMALPADSTTVAWYRYGPSPGEAGSAVLAAHVDWTDGPGPFYRLRELRPGDRVTVGLGDGARAFRVVARRIVAKEALPALVWKRRGRPVLTLITCGGSYDPVRRHYDENVVVFALPA